MAQRWEYKVLRVERGSLPGDDVDADELETQLNELGGYFWELATVLESRSADAISSELVLIFKRPVTRGHA